MEPLGELQRGSGGCFVVSGMSLGCWLRCYECLWVTLDKQCLAQSVSHGADLGMGQGRSIGVKETRLGSCDSWVANLSWAGQIRLWSQGGPMLLEVCL